MCLLKLIDGYGKISLLMSAAASMEEGLVASTSNNNGSESGEMSDQLEEAIIANDTEKLKQLLQSALNINVALSNKKESALILAVKLTKRDVVKLLLESGLCDINRHNVNQYSPLDVALITTFDNRREPRHSECWKIVSLLLQNGAEPSSRDAMMYVVRTSLKYIDDQFINQLIDYFLLGTYSPMAHELLLTKLHRSQPIYEGIIDHFLVKISLLTIKIIKQANMATLSQIVSTFVYYIDSHWNSKELEIKTVRRLVLYSSAAGFKWRNSDITLVKRVSEELALICQKQAIHVPSLQHICRVKVRGCVKKSVFDVTNKLTLPNSIKQYLLLDDIDKLKDVVNNIIF
ncbi:hypothetical protein SNE40_005007 [Patella caerulea]|uniref:SOCS box domain-containing protein n=1 Tax=Patella caerulea TaxID=87958 RepID=A0AAN8Q6A2_PATCE